MVSRRSLVAFFKVVTRKEASERVSVDDITIRRNQFPTYKSEMSKQETSSVRLICLPVLDTINVQLEIPLGPHRLFPEQFRAIMCLQKAKSIYQETETTMHLCSFLVILVNQLDRRRLDWLQKKDLPTLITYNIINNSFLLTIQCSNNIPLFKLIVKSIIQELYDPANIRESSNHLKEVIPDYFKTLDVKLAEQQLLKQLFGDLKHFVNILYGRNQDKIAAHQSIIQNLLQSKKELPTSTPGKSQQSADLRISKYKTLQFPYKQQVIRVLFLMALNILKFEHYYAEDTIFAKRSVLTRKDIHQCSKFIRAKLLFMTEKILIPYESKTKYYRDKFTKAQYLNTLSKFKDKYTSLFMQALFSQSGLSFQLFQQVLAEMRTLTLTETELNQIRETLNKTL